MNFLTKKMKTIFRTTIKTAALRKIKARARTWISGHLFPISAFSEHQTYRQSLVLLISFKRCFLLESTSPNNSNCFIILPNNSNRVSLKRQKSSETKFVWSNLNRVETYYVRQLELKHFSHQFDSKIIGPVLLSKTIFSHPNRFLSSVPKGSKNEYWIFKPYYYMPAKIPPKNY